MKKTFIWLVSIVGIIVLLILLYLRFFSWFPSNIRNVNALMNELDSSFSKELAEGTDCSQVQLFLESHKIEHSDLLDEPQKDSDFQRSPKLDGKRDKVTSQIVAIKRNVGFSGLFVTWSISMHFYFDKQKKLVEYTLNVVGTGP